MSRYQENRQIPSAFLGYMEEGEKGPSVSGTVPAKNCKIIAPYGVAARPCHGDLVGALQTDGYGYVLLGQVQDISDLEEGEIRIRSSGGAEIRLCTNGDIVLNQVRITKNGVIETP